jgi:hypothetical protein
MFFPEQAAGQPFGTPALIFKYPPSVRSGTTCQNAGLGRLGQTGTNRFLPTTNEVEAIAFPKHRAIRSLLRLLES